MKRNRSRLVLYISIVTILVLSFFLSTGISNAQDKKLTFYYVDHGTPGNPFWAVYYKGIEDATQWLAQFGVEVKHLSA